MFTKTKYLIEIWQPKPTKTLVRGFPVKEGKTLPNSVTEDIGGFSLAPQYSNKQLRKISKHLKYKNRQAAKVVKKQWGFTRKW
jgi:hypothetical protein